MRVLIVEDEEPLARSLQQRLERDGCAVAVALNGTDGLRMARHDRYDVIVLDLMLPGLNGYRLCAELRSASVWTPILVLTAKDGELDESEALDTGADGYLRKPFSHVVLLAHLRALVRRGQPARPTVLTAGDLSVDPAARRCWRGVTEVQLTGREFTVLEHLARHAGTAVTKQDILDYVWGDEFDGAPNIVEVYVRYLRRKIDEPFDRSAIRTVRGVGYCLDAAGG